MVLVFSFGVSMSLVNSGQRNYTLEEIAYADRQYLLPCMSHHPKSKVGDVASSLTSFEVYFSMVKFWSASATDFF